MACCLCDLSRSLNLCFSSPSQVKYKWHKIKSIMEENFCKYRHWKSITENYRIWSHTFRNLNIINWSCTSTKYFELKKRQWLGWRFFNTFLLKKFRNKGLKLNLQSNIERAFRHGGGDIETGPGNNTNTWWVFLTCLLEYNCFTIVC